MPYLTMSLCHNYHKRDGRAIIKQNYCIAHSFFILFAKLIFRKSCCFKVSTKISMAIKSHINATSWIYTVVEKSIIVAWIDMRSFLCCNVLKFTMFNVMETGLSISTSLVPNTWARVYVAFSYSCFQLHFNTQYNQSTVSNNPQLKSIVKETFIIVEPHRIILNWLWNKNVFLCASWLG